MVGAHALVELGHALVELGPLSVHTPLSSSDLGRCACHGRQGEAGRTLGARARSERQSGHTRANPGDVPPPGSRWAALYRRPSLRAAVNHRRCRSRRAAMGVNPRCRRYRRRLRRRRYHRRCPSRRAVTGVNRRSRRRRYRRRCPSRRAITGVNRRSRCRSRRRRCPSHRAVTGVNRRSRRRSRRRSHRRRSHRRSRRRRYRRRHRRRHPGAPGASATRRRNARAAVARG